MNTTTQPVTANVTVKKVMDWAISSQADRVTGGRFRDQSRRPVAGYEAPRVPDYPFKVEDMIRTAEKSVETGVKLPGDNRTKVIKTSQRGRDVDLTYDADEFLSQLIDAGEELRLDEEAAAVSRNAATAEVAATSGALMAGAATWAIHNTSRGAGGADAVLDGGTNVGGGPATAPTAGTARGFTETLMRDALRAGWNDGARFNLCMSTGDMIENIAGYMFTSSARVATMQTDLPQSNRRGVGEGNGAQAGGMVAQGAVNMFVGNFGVVTLTPNRQMAVYDSSSTDCVDVLFIDTRYPVISRLHGYGTKRLNATGLYDQEVLFVDSTFIPGATRSITTVSDIDPTTAMVA